MRCDTGPCGAAPDADHDGHRSIACGGDDCDDTDANQFPGNTEICDLAGHDEDCSPCTVAGASPDGDTDHDSFVSTRCFNTYTGPMPTTCDALHTLIDTARTRVIGSDCDDTNANVHPNQTETCNAIDDNCDGTIDEGFARNTYYPDCDSDHYGVPGTTAMGCIAPIAPPASCATGGWSTDNTDCDDTHATVHPGLPASADTSTCDGLDNDCDPTTSELTVPCPGIAAGYCSVGAVCLRALAAVQVVAGYAHACARMSDGSVRCWGSNTSGQLGDGTNVNRPTPVQVPGLVGVMELSAGGYHTCARLGDGTVQCWGRNQFGALGNGTINDSSTPTTVPGLTGVVELSAGHYHTCARLRDGTVRCMGRNTNGQLGDGTTADQYVPTTVSGLANAVGVSAGVDHTCARLVDGTARCWGDNFFGQLGDGTTTARPTATMVATLTGIVALHSGGSHTCALLTDGSAQCWGRNDVGQLGDGTTTPRSTPTAIPSLRRVSDLTAGITHTCARLADQTVRCWGGNNSGQVGDGTTMQRNTPTVVSGLSGVVELSANPSAFFTCARTVDGGVQCWGSDDNGQLGDGTTTNATTPVAVQGLGVVELSAGLNHTCARFGDGRVACWGDNTSGGLGLGSAIPHVMIPTSGVGFVNAAAVSAGSTLTCALILDGTVRCAGYNAFGQIGDGTLVDRSSPTVVAGLTNVAEVRAGTAHVCARLLDGTVQCWGSNLEGQIGDGTTIERHVPTAIPALTGVVELAAGAFHTCARLTDGTVRCWGDNANGQLGQGSVSARITLPTAVPGIASAVEIAAAGAHTCARLSDSTVTCWGANANGQIGDGTTTDRASPTPLPALSNVVEISAGGFATTFTSTPLGHTCARSSDGTVRCWGNNDSGQLGDGTTTSHPSPTPVSALGGSAVQLVTGSHHSCARLSDGSVQCWGRNNAGQLGDGTLTNRLVPTTLLSL